MDNSVEIFKMVRALEEQQAQHKSRLFHLKGMDENAERQAHSMVMESTDPLSPMADRLESRSQASAPLSNEPMQIGFSLNHEEKGPKSRLRNNQGAESPRSKTGMSKIS